MNIAIIGRGDILFNCALELIEKNYNISLIITSKEAPEYNKKANDFKELANKIHATFLNTPKINQDLIISKIKSLKKIDLAVSINYTGILNNKVISCFKHGVLNAHGGDLPRFRGNACHAWAIINKEKRVALCIHKMIGGELDSGNIIEREYLNINLNTRIGVIFDWMDKITPRMMLKAVNSIQVNPNSFLESQSQDKNDSLRCYPRTPEDGKINWNNPSESILRLINASSEPFSGAYCLFKSSNLIIWRASLVKEKENYLAVPGQISKIRKDGFVEVICGSAKKILIKEVTYKQQRTSNPASVIKSIRTRLI